VTAKTISLLTYPQPKSHIFYPYSDEEHIAEAVGLFAAAGLFQDQTVVLITCGEKRRHIEERLTADGFDVAELKLDGRLAIVEADRLLRSLLRDGKPDRGRFREVIRNVISISRANAPSGGVRLYGEMVNILCAEGNVAAAMELEELWNEAVELHSVPLLCSYASQLLKPHWLNGTASRLMQAHTDMAA
jgi:hypothetical protein